MIRLIITLIAMGAAGAIFFLYTKPAYDGVQATRAQIAQYDAALTKAAELQQIKQELLSRFNAFKPEDLERLHKLLPDHVDNVRLILDLDNLAERFGLALQNVDVSSSQSKDEKSQTVGGALGGANQKYDSLTLTFSTRATYTTFIDFLRDLESSLRIVDLVSLSIAPESGTASAGTARTASAEPQYGYNITLRTYWLK